MEKQGTKTLEIRNKANSDFISRLNEKEKTVKPQKNAKSFSRKGENVHVVPLKKKIVTINGIIFYDNIT